VRPHGQVGRYGYTPEQARALSARVVQAAAANPGLFHGDAHDLALVVYEYALRQGGYAIRTTREVADVFEDQGFDVQFDQGAGTAERERDRPCSTAGMDTYRMRIIARKR
jgi:hypothetical protein